MRTRIVRIGNSQGIRIPKPLLEQSGIGEEVEMIVRPGEIVIRAASHPRAGWEDGARWEGAQVMDEETREWLDAPLNSWEDEEWEWDGELE